MTSQPTCISPSREMRFHSHRIHSGRAGVVAREAGAQLAEGDEGAPLAADAGPRVGRAFSSAVAPASVSML